MLVGVNDDRQAGWYAVGGVIAAAGIASWSASWAKSPPSQVLQIIGYIVTVVGLLIIFFAMFHLGSGRRGLRKVRANKDLAMASRVQGNRLELLVTNTSRHWAKFKATVIGIEPKPTNLITHWTLAWSGSSDAVQDIGPNGDSWPIILGEAGLWRRDTDDELAGSIAFERFGASNIPFNYENTAESAKRIPVIVTVRVARIEPSSHIDRKFKITLEPISSTGKSLPRIVEVTDDEHLGRDRDSDRRLSIRLFQEALRHRVAAGIVLVCFGTLVGALGIWASDHSRGNGLAANSAGDSPAVTGDIALVRENGTPRLIFPLAAGGIGYCSRSDDRWSVPWSGVTIDSHWPGIQDATIFFSSFNGFEVLGSNGGTLTFGYRDNQFRWHVPKSVLDDSTGNAVDGVSGPPAFLQYLSNPSAQAKFLAMVPVDSGGLDIYERDGISQDWHMMGSLEQGLGRISYASAVYINGQGIRVVLRVGSQLYEMTRNDRGLPGQFQDGWSAAQKLTVSGIGQITTTEDPAFVYSNITGDSADDMLLLAVPVPHGLALLDTSPNMSGAWTSELLPIRQEPGAVALLRGYADGQPNVEIIYRQAETMYSIWKPDGKSWQGPTKIRC